MQEKSILYERIYLLSAKIPADHKETKKYWKYIKLINEGMEEASSLGCLYDEAYGLNIEKEELQKSGADLSLFQEILRLIMWAVYYWRLESFQDVVELCSRGSNFNATR